MAGKRSADQIDAKEEGFRVFQDMTSGSGVDTFIRFNHTCAAGGSGKMHTHVLWEPVGEGCLIPA